MGVLQQIWLHEKSMEAYFWHVKILQCGYMEYGFQDIIFYLGREWHIEAETNGHYLPDDIFKCIFIMKMY